MLHWKYWLMRVSTCQQDQMKFVLIQQIVWWLTWKHLPTLQDSVPVGLFPSSVALSMQPFYPNALVLTRKHYGLNCTNFRPFAEQWCSYLTSLQVPAEPVFYQHYTEIIFDKLVKQNIPNLEEKDASVSPCWWVCFKIFKRGRKGWKTSTWHQPFDQHQ